jgi:regulator of chromosome condensation
MLDVYVYGSGECDQFGKFIIIIGIPDVFESKNPRKVTISQDPTFKVFKIACGAMHTLILTSMGTVYSFGCADRGVLGRDGDSEPRLVDTIKFPMNNIVAGDVNSVAYNTDENLVYRWGVYRVK